MRNLAKRRIVPWLFQVTGGRIINKDELVGFGINVVKYAGEFHLKIPSLHDCNVPDGEYIKEENIIFPETNIFRLDHKTHGDCLKKYNSIILGRKNIIASGGDANLAKVASFIPNFLNGKKRREDVILAPWPHRWSTYGDFMIFGLPKLAGLWDALTQAEKEKAVVSFPFSIGTWAHEYTELIGIPRERHVDSCKEQIGLSKAGVLISGDGPNLGLSIAHPQDITVLRRLIHHVIPPNNGNSFLGIYVQRIGRRKILNEEKIINKLKNFGFLILEDKPRSVNEQLAIFNNANIVVGPHGAGLSNSINSQNKVSIVEAKSSMWDYQSQRYYCAMIKSEYRALYDRRFGKGRGVIYQHISNDIIIDPEMFISVVKSLISS